MKCRLILIILIFFIITPNCLVWAQSSDILYIEATDALNEANYEKAIELFSKYLKLEPNNEKSVSAKYNLADAYYRQEKFLEAAKLYEEIANLNPDNELAPESLTKSAESYGKVDDKDNMVRAFKKVINLYPETSHAEFARYQLAELKIPNKPVKVIVPTGTKTEPVPGVLPQNLIPEDIDIQEDALLKTAKDVFKAKDYKTALDLFNRFLYKFPKSEKAAYAQLKIAECYYYQEYYKNALNAYKKVLNYPTTEYKEYAQYSIGWCYYRLNDYKNTLATLGKLITTYPQGKYVNSAKDEVEKIKLQLQEEESKNLFNKAKNLNEKGEFKSAADTLTELINKYPQTSGVNEAIELLNKLKELISEISYKEGNRLWTEGEKYLADNELNKAEENFKQLVSSYPENNYCPLAQEALKLIQQKQIDQKARLEFENGLEYLEKKDYNNARIKFEGVLKKFPDSNYKKDAETKLKETLSYQADVGAYKFYKRALNFVKEEDYDQAVEAFQQVIDKYPNSNYVPLSKDGIADIQDSVKNQQIYRQFEIAKKYYELGDYNKAVESFKQIQTNYPNTHYSQRADEFIKNISNTSQSKSVEEEYEIAQNIYNKGELSEAKERFLTIISKYPKSRYTKAAQENVDSINKRITNENVKELYDAGRRFQEYGEYKKAISNYQDVLEKYPNNFWAVYSQYAKAESLYAQNSYLEAKNEWEKVINGFKGSDLAPHALYHVAECYEQLGDFKQAKENYQKLQKEYPNSIYAKGDLADLIRERIGR